ncbi:MAG: hypothetical protein L3J05_10185 [Robiginitomaculum sp.]|nr:hypothetical protein [Robiginitomaculum sp.]
MHDARAAPALLDWLDDPLAIVADKAYNLNKNRRMIKDNGALAVILVK